MSKKNYIACYCRVSTDKKEQENSFENQKSFFEREIKKDKGNILVDIYADEGFTGTKLNNRPEFNRMLYDAGIDVIELYSDKKDRRIKKKHTVYEVSDRKPKFSEIWIKNTSRFARNTLSFEIIEKLRQKGVYVRFIEQNINTKDIGSDLLLKLFQLFDEQDSKDKSLKVSTGIREGAIKGVVNANSRLYGYRYIKEENRLEIIEEEAKVIREIFDLYSKGYGFRRIINHLEEKGIKTREGKPFGKSSIRRILTNEKYIGLNVRMKYTTGRVFNKESYPKIRPCEEWLNLDKKSEKIPAIVSDEIFYKCQNIMQNKVNHINRKGIYNGITEYAGLIICGKCGAKYISNSDKGRKFYNCSTKKLKGTKCCNNPNVSLKDLDNQINEISYMTALLAYKEHYFFALIFLYYELFKKVSQSNIDDINELKQELSKLYEKKDKYIELFTDGIISKDELVNKTKTIDSKIKELEGNISEITKPNNEILKDMKELEKTLWKIETLEIKAHYTKDEIIEDIEKIIIHEDKQIEVIYKTKYLIDSIAENYNIENVYNNEEFREMLNNDDSEIKEWILNKLSVKL